MNKQSFKFLTILTALLAVWLVVSTGAFAQGGERVVITAPTDGQSVSGIVKITGIVEFAEFQKYELYLRSGQNLAHVATVYAPVINGLLANLDSRTFPDGAYEIVVRTVREDSNYSEFTGPSFTIVNGLDAPLPHPEVQQSPLYTPLQPGSALFRIQNCSGKDLEFDYTSPDGFCSAQDYWIMAKAQDAPLCETVDALVIGGCEYRGTAWGSGEDRARTYSLETVPGQIYEIVYAGGTDLFINPVEPDATFDAEPALGDAHPPSSGSMLPVSGQSAPASAMPFVVGGVGLIVLMVAGGVVATRRGKSVS